MPKKKKRNTHHGFLFVGLLIIVILALIFQYVPLVTSHSPVPVLMAICFPTMPGCPGYASTKAVTTSQVSGVISVTTAGLQAIHVENVWQIWNVKFRDGSTRRFASDSPTGLTQQLAEVVSSEPSILDLTVPIQLVTDVLPTYNDGWTTWYTVINNIPTVTVWLNGRPAQAVSQDLFNPIAFKSGDKINSEQDWNVRVVFQGGANYCGQVSFPCVDVSGDVGGSTSLQVQIGVTILSTSYRAYTASASSIQCGNTMIYVGITSGAAECPVGTATSAVPYGLTFTWTTADTGTASYMMPTAAISYCQSNYCFVFTVTKNQIVTLWGHNATLIAPTTTVIQNGPPVPTGGNGNGNTNNSGNNSTCQIQLFNSNIPLIGQVSQAISLPAWMCGKTFGINNIVLLIIVIGVLLLLLGVALAMRRGGSGGSGSGAIVNIRVG